MNAYKLLIIMFCLNAGMALGSVLVPVAGIELGIIPTVNSNYYDTTGNETKLTAAEFVVNYVLGTAGLGVGGLIAVGFIASRNTTLAGILLFASFFAMFISMAWTLTLVLRRILDPQTSNTIIAILGVFYFIVWVMAIVQLSAGGHKTHA